MSEVPRRNRTVAGLGRSRGDIRREQAEEIEQHLAARTAELVSGGMPAQDARAQAEREFGDVARARELLATADERSYRAGRRRVWTADLLLDVRYALRGLGRTPGFTFVVLVTLILGMGATTAIFSVFNAYLLRPLPFPSSDRLVLVHDQQPDYGTAPASFEEFVDWTELDGPFDGVAALFRRSRNFEGGEYPERVRVALVSEQFLELTAPRLIAGRLFTPVEAQEGAPPVMLLTESFWRTRLGGDRRVLDTPLRIDGVAITAIGVIADLPQLWAGDPVVALQPLVPNAPWRDRGTHYLTVWARLRPGITVESANARLRAAAAALQQERGSEHGIMAVPLRELIVGDARPLFVVILGAVLLVLVIACVNVANLMLARTARRAEEFALRAALGAGRARITRQLLVEGLVLSILGAAGGIAVGAFGARALLAALPESMPRPSLVVLDVRVLGMAAAAVLGATLLLGMTPVVVELRGALASILRPGRTAGSGRYRGRTTRHALVVLELALCTALLAGASLMVRSFARLMRVDAGVRADGVVTFHSNLPSSRYESPERRAAFFAQLEERLRRRADVAAVGSAANLPLSGGGMNGDFQLEGETDAASRTRRPAEKRIVTPAYFATLGIGLVSGRLFDTRDRSGQPRVVLINETMARTVWPERSPLGQRINSLSPDGEWEEVIGVVRDVRSDGLDRSAPLEILYPHAQHPSGSMIVAVRARADAAALVPQLRAEILALDPLQPIHTVRVMDDVIAQTVAGKRLLLLLATGLGLLALLLAAVGTAGIIGYGVARRTREIGVRVALGARPSAVLALIMTEALGLAAAGVLLGMVGGVVMGDALRSQLFEIAPTDGAAHTAAVATLLLAAAAAAFVPARRVLAIDPLRAIRAE